jgi:hypothetical protein
MILWAYVKMIAEAFEQGTVVFFKKKKQQKQQGTLEGTVVRRQNLVHSRVATTLPNAGGPCRRFTQLARVGTPKKIGGCKFEIQH